MTPVYFLLTCSWSNAEHLSSDSPWKVYVSVAYLAGQPLGLQAWCFHAHHSDMTEDRPVLTFSLHRQCVLEKTLITHKQIR